MSHNSEDNPVILEIRDGITTDQAMNALEVIADQLGLEDAHFPQFTCSKASIDILKRWKLKYQADNYLLLQQHLISGKPPTTKTILQETVAASYIELLDMLIKQAESSQ